MTRAAVRKVSDEDFTQSPSGTQGPFCVSSQRKIMGRERTILIVEDHDDTRELYACCLALEGFQVRSACDGVEGIADLNERRPELVVLDFALPRLSGAAVLRHMRASAALQRTPVILVSAQIKEFIAAVEGLSFQAALEKPCDLSDLVEAVHQHLPAAAAPRQRR